MSKKVTREELLYKEQLIERFYRRELTTKEQKDFLRFRREDAGFAARLEIEEKYLEGLLSTVASNNVYNTRLFKILIFLLLATMLVTYFAFSSTAQEASPEGPTLGSMVGISPAITEARSQEQPDSTLTALTLKDTISSAPPKPAGSRQSEDTKERASKPAPPPPEGKSIQQVTKLPPQLEEEKTPSVSPNETVTIPPEEVAIPNPNGGIVEINAKEDSVQAPALLRSRAPRVREAGISSRWQNVMRAVGIQPSRLNRFYIDRQQEIDAQINAFRSTGVLPRRWGPGSLAQASDYSRKDLVSEAYMLATVLRTNAQHGKMYDDFLRIFADKVANYGGSVRNQLELLRSLNDFPGLPEADREFVRQHVLYLQAAYCYLYGEIVAGRQLRSQLQPDDNFLFPWRFQVLLLQP